MSMFQAASLGGETSKGILTQHELKRLFLVTWITRFFEKRFFIMSFLKKEVQINKTNYETMLVMSKEVSLLKTSSRTEKYENRTKKRYVPFLHESLQL